jgi:hypothetical protein
MPLYLRCRSASALPSSCLVSPSYRCGGFVGMLLLTWCLSSSNSPSLRFLDLSSMPSSCFFTLVTVASVLRSLLLSSRPLSTLNWCGGFSLATLLFWCRSSSDTPAPRSLKLGLLPHSPLCVSPAAAAIRIGLSILPWPVITIPTMLYLFFCSSRSSVCASL